MYAPSDFDNQDHCLIINKIKDCFSGQVGKIFSEINKDGSRLTKEEVEKAKKSIEQSIDIAAELSRSERVIEFLTDSPSQSPAIDELLGISNQPVLNVISFFSSQGKLKKYKKHGHNRFTWEVNV
ncbi:hypothetical protein [Vreelandella venusta]|uniref:hypothetical protein n=1 Tax=Vreelandella venusta TaxID=44935 RepID=UPI00200DDB6F|nr:hypothetical protein [Halomonas venusta]UQI39298.1 hypothetical protein M3L73_13805 [Halomonas venusta]